MPEPLDFSRASSKPPPAPAPGKPQPQQAPRRRLAIVLGIVAVLIVAALALGGVLGTKPNIDGGKTTPTSRANNGGEGQ